MSRNEIMIGGFGGQGVILAGYIVGQAAAIFDGRNATMTQDYGPEARGGSCRAQVVISKEQISNPYSENPSVLVAMSQEAYTKYAPGLSEDALLLIDKELVKLKKSRNDRTFAIPATGIARELGRSAVSNIVMLGFLTAVAKIVSVKAMKQSILNSVPKGTEELNEKAFERGYSYGLEVIKSRSGDGR
ncbi:2-oxoacid:acceptor oxidoreductase family protein [Chloroflexota bacterium]